MAQLHHNGYFPQTCRPPWIWSARNLISNSAPWCFMSSCVSEGLISQDECCGSYIGFITWSADVAVSVFNFIRAPAFESLSVSCCLAAPVLRRPAPLRQLLLIKKSASPPSLHPSVPPSLRPAPLKQLESWHHRSSLVLTQTTPFLLWHFRIPNKGK